MSEQSTRLLLVDDDVSAIQAMSRMLVDYPNQRFATSGMDAIRLAREVPPDLIVLDAEMPGMSGLEVCDALHADPKLANIPVIFATSHDSSALEVAALKRGASDFIRKPIVATQLQSRVRARLRGAMSLSLAAPSVSSRQPARLLIVDDDVSAIQVLSSTVSHLGELHFATSGEEALRIATALRPDLMLLDVHMPGMDGFSLFSLLKTEPRLKHVPVVFVTRYSEPANEMRALDLGAAEFVAKPYTPAVLRARVRNLLDLKRRMDEEIQAQGAQWRQVGDARVAAIVGAASDAIMTVDIHRRVVLANAAACRLMGAQANDLVGCAVPEWLGSLLDSAGPLGATSTRVPLPPANGRAWSTEASMSTSGEGEQQLTTVVLRDISDRERLERETSARLQAEAAAQMKARMLAYITHEIGNPLNGVIGFGQLMATDAEHPLGGVQAQRLKHLMSSAWQLQGLMRDTLDLGRFESGNLSFDIRPLVLADELQVALDASRALAEERRVDLRATLPGSTLRVLADSQRLQQVLLNLLSNAIKYNRPAGAVDVSVSTDAGSVAISVQDNGIGIEAEQQQHLFEPFNRLGRQRSSTPGAGLGLVITRQLIEAMGGRLGVRSSAGEGSCFTVLLPGVPV